MSHQELLRSKEETLLRIIHPNVLLLALLAEQDWLDEYTEQAVTAERTNFDRNRRLLDWLRQSPREAVDGFLRALRANGQGHVANYIDGTPGDLPLCSEARKRLRRIKCHVIDILDAGNKLLAYLYQEHVIGDTDYHCLLSESSMTNRSSMLMDVILRGSEHGFACFCEFLSSDVNQAYLVPCLERGEILPIHVKVQPEDKEKGIVEMLKKMISMKDKLEELSSSERSCANDLLQQLNAVLVGACITDSITMFVHLLTSEVLGSVRDMFDNGQLTIIVRDLFRCLSRDESLTVEVEIGADLFVECEDGFADDGSFYISCCKPGNSDTKTESETAELQRLKEENLRMKELIDNLKEQKHDANWIIVDDCLRTIEKDSALSEASKDAVQRARNCVGDNVVAEATTKVYKLQNLGAWLHTSDFGTSDIVDSWIFDTTLTRDIGDDAASVDTGFISDFSQSHTTDISDRFSYY